jgi:arylsulfatase A-like enzyme
LPHRAHIPLNLEKWLLPLRERRTNLDHKRKHERSLVLVTVDCLRADHCGFYGYSRPTTPFLDSLASESYVVPTAIVGGAPTYYSLPTILASRMPMALGRDVVGLAPGETTLATTLRDSGYATAAFSASNPYISPRFGYDQGFDLFRDFLDCNGQSSEDECTPSSPPQPNSGHASQKWLTLSGDGVNSDAVAVASKLTRRKVNEGIRRVASTLGLSQLYNHLYFEYCMKTAPNVTTMAALRRYPAADILVDKAESWLASLGSRPFFLWLHLMDPHAPYYPPNDAFRYLTGRESDPGRARYVNEYWNRLDQPVGTVRRKRNEILQLYDAGIRWVDIQTCRLIDVLRRLGFWDDCVFALTADHGEEFLEHAGRFHAPVRLSEEIVRVPLLIRVPGDPSTADRATVVPSSPMSHLHLAPTLLDAMGMPSPSAFQGRTLWKYLQNGIGWDEPALIECVYGCTNPFRPESRNKPTLLGVRGARFKLVMRLEPDAKEQVYDLEADPAELHPNGAWQAIGPRKQLLLAASEFVHRTTGRPDMKLRLRARLRDLREEMSH